MRAHTPTTHGDHPPIMMALVTSDCGTMRLPEHQVAHDHPATRSTLCSPDLPAIICRPAGPVPAASCAGCVRPRVSLSAAADRRRRRAQNVGARVRRVQSQGALAAAAAAGEPLLTAAIPMGTHYCSWELGADTCSVALDAAALGRAWRSFCEPHQQHCRRAHSRGECSVHAANMHCRPARWP